MSPFQRLLSVRSLFRGQGLSVLAWASAAALLGALVLSLGVVLVDLLVERGNVSLRGDVLTAIAPDSADPIRGAAPQNPEADTTYVLHDQGLLATALRFHDRLIAAPLRSACSRFPLLHDNSASAIVLIGMLILAGVCWRVSARRADSAGMRLGMRSSAQLRQSIHRQALRLTPGDLDGDAVRSTQELFNHDADKVAAALARWASRVPGELLTLLLMVALAVAADPQLTLLCVVPVGIAWWLTLFKRNRLAQARSLADARGAHDLANLGAGLAKARLVRGYGMEEVELKQFQSHLERLMLNLTRGRTTDGGTAWLARIGVIVCLALVIFFVSARVLSTHDPLPFSAGVLLLAALLRGAWAVESLHGAAAARRDVDVFGDRIYRYLALIPEVGQAVGAKFLQPVSKSIIFESVTYRADGIDLLKNCDVRIAARTSTALISIDPAVRRAAAFLLPRFIEPQSGRVLFDSEDTAWATLESLRAETVYVGGADPFFTGTVSENLTCGDSRFSVQEAMEAAKQAHAHNFIQRLPQGYDTVIGEHGENLDAGQAFRLGLARAILRKPAVMIIEEPVEPLDEDTKALLDDAYNRITKGRTVIFLPTRLSTVRRCDPIILIHEGRVAATGNHETLVRQSELYRHWEYVNFKAPQSVTRRVAATA